MLTRSRYVPSTSHVFLISHVHASESKSQCGAAWRHVEGAWVSMGPISTKLHTSWYLVPAYLQAPPCDMRRARQREPASGTPLSPSDSTTSPVVTLKNLIRALSPSKEPLRISARYTPGCCFNCSSRRWDPSTETKSETLLLCRRRSPSAAVSQVTSSQSPAQLCPTLDATLPGSHWKRPGRKIAADAEHESPPGSEGSTVTKIVQPLDTIDRSRASLLRKSSPRPFSLPKPLSSAVTRI
mmetsp:Transcript_8390/g.20410  ORF Transcript_8390/g.20410 Transcript_8390/m.20410 type:complete len:240 (-) Transcript_8390:2256-2975(-)